MTKSVLVVITGAGGELEGRPAEIDTNTTAEELLVAAGLDPKDFQLQLERDGQLVSISNHEKIHAKVKSGDKLHVIPTNVVVG